MRTPLLLFFFFVFLFPDRNSQPAQTFGDLAAAGIPTIVLLACDNNFYADVQGPPPKKRSRLEDADSSKHSTDGPSTAGPSSASGLDTKLGE